jgi:hypothetical protein
MLGETRVKKLARTAISEAFPYAMNSAKQSGALQGVLYKSNFYVLGS